MYHFSLQFQLKLIKLTTKMHFSNQLFLKGYFITDITQNEQHEFPRKNRGMVDFSLLHYDKTIDADH